MHPFGHQLTPLLEKICFDFDTNVAAKAFWGCVLVPRSHFSCWTRLADTRHIDSDCMSRGEYPAPAAAVRCGPRARSILLRLPIEAAARATRLDAPPGRPGADSALRRVRRRPRGPAVPRPSAVAGARLTSPGEATIVALETHDASPALFPRPAPRCGLSRFREAV